MGGGVGAGRSGWRVFSYASSPDLWGDGSGLLIARRGAIGIVPAQLES